MGVSSILMHERVSGIQGQHAVDERWRVIGIQDVGWGRWGCSGNGCEWTIEIAM